MTIEQTRDGVSLFIQKMLDKGHMNGSGLVLEKTSFTHPGFNVINWICGTTYLAAVWFPLSTFLCADAPVSTDNI